MNHLIDSDLDQDEFAAHRDREISLGPGTILGIFFGLALLCGAVFGLGYTMGRRTGQSAAAAVIVGTGSPATLGSATKPTAGSAAAEPQRSAPPDELTASAPPVASGSKTSAADALIVGDRLPRAAAPAAPAPPPTSTAALTASFPPAPPAPAPPAPSPGGTFMVQIAAVSTQEIADIELAALKKYNYPVVVRHEPADQLLHIQLGPYATRKDAEAMRQNVQSHGFNAIVK
ncbi:MAG: SPOR domain-containing protein [Acidobacteriota bacterium]|nr:SPOR domain-containing protein [Acidobacteriota bacterium]